MNNLLSGIRSPKELDGQSRWLKSITFDGFLGEGALGVVVKAVDKTDLTATAVKIIFQQMTDDKSRTEEKKRISREFNNLVDKRHTNIVSTLKIAQKSFSQTDIETIFEGMTLEEKTLDNIAKFSAKAKRLGKLDTTCIQMELCGHTLRSWLNKEEDRQPSYFQVKIVQGLVDGLKFLHQNKIIHRDLNPSNIYFRTAYSVPIKIGDFGLCRELDDDNSMSITGDVGTRDYMAPEVRTTRYSYQADLYSLGLVLWEVFQFIRKGVRSDLFQKLVRGNDHSLVKDHPLIVNAKEIIIKLTKAEPAERAQRIEEIKFNFLLKAKNTEELKKCLEVARKGDVIELDEGEYVGPFLMKLNLVTLWGKGANTILRNCLQGTNSDFLSALRIMGNNCEIICIKVICDNKEYSCGVDVEGSCNTIKDVQFEGGMICLNLRSDENTGSNLSINNADGGIRVGGSRNRLDNIRVTEITGTSIDILGSNNEVVALSCENVRCGVVFGGDDNKLRNIVCHNNRPTEGSEGVRIWSGSGHMLDNLKFTGFTNYGLDILNSTTQSIIISNSVCERIWVGGSDHKLINVDAMEVLVIYGSGHRLENCKAKKCINEGKSVTPINCNFKVNFKY